jgi:hypothetical protein
MVWHWRPSNRLTILSPKTINNTECTVLSPTLVSLCALSYAYKLTLNLDEINSDVHYNSLQQAQNMYRLHKQVRRRADKIKAPFVNRQLSKLKQSYWLNDSRPTYRMLHSWGTMSEVNNTDASGFGGLEDACWPLVPKFAGSNPAEAVRFFRAKKSPARLASEGK